MERSDIQVEIQVRQVTMGNERRVLVDFEFRNPTDTKKDIEKWLALEPPVVEIALLRITKADGSAIRYVGEHINRGGIGKEGYLHLAAGASRRVEGVDVTNAYAWPETAQDVIVRYEALSAGQGDLRVLKSKDHKLEYVPPSK